MNKFSVLAIITIIAFSACKKEAVSDNPSIVFDSLSKNIIRDGNDSFAVSFRYSIPTPNLNGDPSSTEIFFSDNRDSIEPRVYELKFPGSISDYEIPENRDHIRGVVTFGLSASANNLTLRPNRPNGDTATFDVYIIDPSGRQSNTITTSEIYIVP